MIRVQGVSNPMRAISVSSSESPQARTPILTDLMHSGRSEAIPANYQTIVMTGGAPSSKAALGSSGVMQSSSTVLTVNNSNLKYLSGCPNIVPQNIGQITVPITSQVTPHQRVIVPKATGSMKRVLNAVQSARVTEQLVPTSSVVKVVKKLIILFIKDTF